MRREHRNHPVSLAERVRIDAHAAWLAARDPRAPWHARAVGLVVAAYALSPIDLVPDFIPVLGLIDDAVLIPLGLWLFVKLLPAGLFEEHRVAAAAAAQRPRSIAGMFIVVGLWVAIGWLILSILRFHYA